MLTAEELDRLCVVLVNSRNPLNIGAAARAMSNFGFLRLRVVRPYDVAFREARSAVDAEPVLTAAEEFEEVAAAVADCSLVVGTTDGSRRNPQEPLYRLEAAAELVRERLRSGGKVAVLFGSEKVGLSNHELNHCDVLARIPTRTEHSSMNLGQAVGIVLYEMIRAAAVAKEAADEEPPAATAGDRERLAGLVLEALEGSGYTHHGPEATLEEKVRRLVRHLELTHAEAQEWMGLVRKMLWKMEHGAK
ncbi:MAG TPA: TrmH family RNA methyltransferase [Acidobacteriaceae bacterium]|nr:TrmH family RNA methyltransferase [Acidobacteriaceae bacterium]